LSIVWEEVVSKSDERAGRRNSGMGKAGRTGA
jgi:hypothetical protein